MNQSSFIAAMLLAGFVLFLAAKNRLSAYTAVLWGPITSGTPATTTSTGGSSTNGAAPASAASSPLTTPSFDPISTVVSSLPTMALINSGTDILAGALE